MPKKILIIEDDLDILDLMNYILADEGYETVSATDGALLENVEGLKPDLILLDNRLTDGLGKDFCRELKLDPATAHFPVILFSADGRLKEMAMENLADGYLPKPFDLDELLALVRRFD